jgi:hypothetical protein
MRSSECEFHFEIGADAAREPVISPNRSGRGQV